MTIQKVYLETTIFNFYFDDQQYFKGHLATKAMFEAIGRGEFEGYTSEYVSLELKKAPEPKRSDMLNLIDKYDIVTLGFAVEIENLANLYIDNGIIPVKHRLDALHIACSAVNNIDIILSFNYEHINKFKTKLMTTNINILKGYKGIIISTPLEFMDNGKNS